MDYYKRIELIRMFKVFLLSHLNIHYYERLKVVKKLCFNFFIFTIIPVLFLIFSKQDNKLDIKIILLIWQMEEIAKSTDD